MPTKRTRRTRGKQNQASTAEWHFLNDALDELEENEFTFFELLNLKHSFYPHKDLSLLWNANREDVLKRWLLTKPGTRPHCWWLLDAPPLPEDQKGKYVDTYIGKELKEPRKRLSGTGTESHEVLAIAPHFRYGVSTSWVTPFVVAYYNGVAKNIHGILINPKANDGDFKGVAIDPNDPPVFESQAAYLDRFGLLTAIEKKKSNFEPESVLDVINYQTK